MMTALIYAIISIPLFLIVFATAKERVSSIAHSSDSSQQSRTTYLMIITLIMLLGHDRFHGQKSRLHYYVIYCLGCLTMIALIYDHPCAVSSVFSVLCSVL